MSRQHLQTILRHAESLAADPSAIADTELLAQFVATRDDRAFSQLVRRHGAMVWSVCRNLLPGDADAEDAFQATFLALVRGGHRIRQGDRLASWLHGVAFRVAMKVRRTAAKRRQRETVAATVEADVPVSESSWNDLLAAVHEEVERLPESLRAAFVLCCLEGARQHDAANQLGLKLNTLTARLARARQRVLDRLARRGIAVSAATGAIAVGSATGNASVPIALAERATAFATSLETVSPSILQLSQGAFDMGLRTKWLAAALLVAGAMTTTVGTVFFTNATGQFPDGPGQPGRGSSRGGPGGAAGSGGNLAAARAALANPPWEYKILKVPTGVEEFEKDLNALGDDGWELTVAANANRFVFKRQKSRRLPPGMFGGEGSAGGAGDASVGGSAIGGSGGPGASGGGRSGAAGGSGTGGVEKKNDTSTEVIPLKHTRASSLSATISPLLAADDGGRGGFGGANPFGGSPRLSGGTKITVDDRTNSLIVIADEKTMKLIKELVEKLDVAVKDDPTNPKK